MQALSARGGAAEGTCTDSKAKKSSEKGKKLIWCRAIGSGDLSLGRRALGGLCLSFLPLEAAPLPAQAAPGAGPLDKPLSGPQFLKTDSGIKVQVSSARQVVFLGGNK